MAVRVNKHLKNLIRATDDEDVLTDGEDEARIDRGINFAMTQSTTGPQRSVQPPASDGEKEAEKEGEKKKGDASDRGTKGDSPPMQRRHRSSAMDSSQEPIRLNLLSVIAVLVAHTKFTAQETRLETLRWLLWLHSRLPKRVCLSVCLSNCPLIHLSLSACLSVSLSLVDAGVQTGHKAVPYTDGYADR